MKRIAWIDIWKGLLILLVVIGHVTGGASHVSEGLLKETYALIYKVIYFFHMPAFFWIAGICWHGQKEGLLSFARKRAVRLLLPYWVFGIISVLVFCVIDGSSGLRSQSTDGYYSLMGNGGIVQSLLSLLHGGGWPKGEGFRCNSVLWFLPSMFAVLCSYFCVDHWLKGRRPQLVLAVILLLSSFFVRHFHLSDLPWGISTIPRYLPFLILGRWQCFNIGEAKVTWYWRAAVGGGWVVFGYLAWLLPDCGLGYYRYGWFLVFLLMTLCGTVLCQITVQLFSLRPIGSRLNFVWVELGVSSLGIMLLHKFIVLGCQLKIPWVREALKSGGCRSIGAVVLVVFVATGVSWFVSRLKYVRQIVG